MTNGMLLLDYFPFKRSVFHVTAGLLFGTSSILKVSGQTDERIEVGDIIIEPGADGRVEAALKTNAVKPYVSWIRTFGSSFTRRVQVRIGSYVPW